MLTAEQIQQIAYRVSGALNNLLPHGFVASAAGGNVIVSSRSGVDAYPLQENISRRLSGGMRERDAVQYALLCTLEELQDDVTKGLGVPWPQPPTVSALGVCVPNVQVTSGAIRIWFGDPTTVAKDIEISLSFPIAE